LLDNDFVYGHLEMVQTHIASGTECARYQACRLLDSVCYMASASNDDCTNYRYVCKDYDDANQIARDSCIPECVFTYWPERIDESTEIDSEGVINCMARGCGIVGSSVDGLCKTSTIVGLSITLMLSLLANVVMACLGCTYKRSLKNLNFTGDPPSEQFNKKNDEEDTDYM
jgi:hypothetical protein